MQGWIESWCIPEMYAGVPGVGAVDAWHEALTEMEETKLNGKAFCGGVADIAKFFDMIIRPVVYRLAKAAGMPQRVLNAYINFLENLTVHNSLVSGMGTPYRRRCGIPQGCLISMTIVALIMRPWVAQMRAVGGVKHLHPG